MVLRGRSRLARTLYDLRILKQRLKLLESRLERGFVNAKQRGGDEALVGSYSNAMKQVRYVVYSLEALEVKLENVLMLNTITQDLVVVREALKELSRRIRSLPEVSAILDEIGDVIGDVIAEAHSLLEPRAVASSREAARRILEEAERAAAAGA